MKIRRIVAQVLIFCLLLSCIPPVQTNAATEGDYTYEVTDGKATITSYTGVGGDIVIPSTLGGCSVTSIGESAFTNCANLTSVEIGDSVTSIGNNAFRYCYKLAKVLIPNSVTIIGKYAFDSCSSLTAVVIPDSVTSISSSAFRHCRNLNGIWVDENNPNYSSDAYGVLFNADKTTLIKAPGALSGEYAIPNSVIDIGAWAFYYCTNLTLVEIGPNVTTVGYQSFYSCTGLTSVVIPNSVISIGYESFYYCARLSSVVIPSSVTGIGQAAFENCTSLIKVIYCGTWQQWNAIGMGAINTTLTNAQRQYHDYQPATCVNPMTCSICGETEGELGEHSGSWQQLVAPSCTDGLEACICDACGETVTRPISATHSYEIVVTAPTCTEGGYTTKTCSACGDQTVTDQTEATGHSYNSVVTAPTCAKDGYTTHTCVTCGNSYVDSYVDGGHNYESVVTAPTCTEQGYTTHTCSACGDSYVDAYVDAKGHGWSAWIQTAAPTCTAEGSQLRFCNCGVQETETIGKLSHSYENGVCTGCAKNMAEAADLSGDGKITAFDGQILAEAQAGRRQLTDAQWEALGDLKPSDILDYVLGRFEDTTITE